ncbi:hypothetical protein KRX57_00145 [Weeksellaceae bacterium TAE3-ERU29]|nr:hypothetical protein [Weeksellaceae bacterium TAE3-ERU29]
MKKWILVCASLGILMSCQTQKKEGINIRVENISSNDFENVIINTSTGNVDFGKLKAGEKSDYKTFETAYSYAYAQVDVNGKTYTFQPMDYVGEEPLSNGSYTYQLDTHTSDQSESLVLTLVKD